MQLPAGIAIPLVLQHHVNSGYTPAGSIIYFRVARDVRVNDLVLVSKGTLVTGQMAQATERGMVGKAGSMFLSIDKVPAVDGTPVPVDADLSKQGRSRAGATAAWTVFWGLPGLITKGVNPYMMRGEELPSVTITATSIDPLAALPSADPADLGPEIALTEYRWTDEAVNKKKKIDIERKKDLGSISFKLALPPGTPEASDALESLRLYQVDGVAVPEEVRAFSSSEGLALFEAWSIARYCGDGSTNLLFVGKGADGKPFHASRDVQVEIKKKN